MSIVLLSVHFLVDKIQRELPTLVIRFLQWLEKTEHEVDSDLKSGFASGSAMGVSGTMENVSASASRNNWLTAEMEALDKLLVEIILFGLGQEKGWDMHANANYHMARGMHISETQQQLTQIIVPVTMMSLFLLMIMTIFLVIHLSFQAILYFFSAPVLPATSLHHDLTAGPDGGNHDSLSRSISPSMSTSPTISNSPIAMAIIMLLILLENVLPWIFFGAGAYFAFCMSGIVWCMVSVSTCLIVLCLYGIGDFDDDIDMDGDFDVNDDDVYEDENENDEYPTE